MTDIQVGDKVRVTIEDEVVKIARDGRTVYLKNESGDDLWFDLDEDNCTCTVEVIEKKVTTFKPGDVVRNVAKRSCYTIGHGGYYSHWSHNWYESGLAFTSKNYELVTLHESPL